MFKCISTGKNPNYGRKGEKVAISDDRVIYCIKNGWIKPNPINYMGWGNPSNLKQPKKELELMPKKRVDVVAVLQSQTNAIERLEKRLEKAKDDNKILINLIKKL